MPINIGGKLGFNHWPLQTGQNILALAQRQTKIFKPTGAFVEAENGVVGDQLAIVVKSTKLNHEAHRVPQYLVDRYASAKQKQPRHSTYQETLIQNLPHFGMLSSEVARQAFKLRAELVERSFALTLDRGGMRRAWLRGRDNVQKRYLIHTNGYNLGLIMRLLTGVGTPRRWAETNMAIIWLICPVDDGNNALIGFLIVTEGQNQITIIGLSAMLLNS